MSPGATDLLFVDAHVHLHHCFDIVPFLEAAHTNVAQHARRMYPGEPFIAVLCLVDGTRQNGFERLLGFAEQQRTAGGTAAKALRFYSTEEDISLCLSFEGNDLLVIVAGRQLVSRENLEVLAIGTRQSFKKDEPTEDLIHQVAQAGALPVIPWGYGKWTASRGKLVRTLLQNPERPPFFLGDSANRPAGWSRSSLFRLAEEQGVRNLPGSDPLPFPSEYCRPGRFGGILQGTLDRLFPARALKETLRDPRTAIQHFGQGEQPFRFVRNQLAMQYRKWSKP